jgi:fucose permease
VSPLLLACLAYLATAVPSSVLGLLWPLIQLTFHAPVGVLGLLLIPGTAAAILASIATGRILRRRTAGPVLAGGTLLIAAALAAESAAPSLAAFTAATVVFGAGFGAIDAALNAHAERHFGARDVNWMHASYGLGSAAGPLLITVLLSDGLGWRLSYGSMGAALAALAIVFLLTRRAWVLPPDGMVPPPDGMVWPADGMVPPPTGLPAGSSREQPHRRRPAVVALALALAAVEPGIEAAAGLWGYVFLTAGRGLSPAAAGTVIAAYWATMFAGRAVLGPVAERAGPRRVLAAAVAGLTVGAAVMAVPGPAVVAVIGLLMLGLAAAPVFPLLIITTTQRTGAVPGPQATRMVSLQVSAATAGSALLPAAAGLIIGAGGARVLAPALFLASLAMCGLYGLLSHRARHAS